MLNKFALLPLLPPVMFTLALISILITTAATIVDEEDFFFIPKYKEIRLNPAVINAPNKISGILPSTVENSILSGVRGIKILIRNSDVPNSKSVSTITKCAGKYDQQFTCYNFFPGDRISKQRIYSFFTKFTNN